jgi:hypothetical protein
MGRGRDPLAVWSKDPSPIAGHWVTLNVARELMARDRDVALADTCESGRHMVNQRKWGLAVIPLSL